MVMAPISVRCRGRNGNGNFGTPTASEMSMRRRSCSGTAPRSARCCPAHAGPRRRPAAVRRSSSRGARAARRRAWHRCRAHRDAESASLSASASFTPSPVMATVCPGLEGRTIERFCCGETRPNTACSSMAAPRFAGSSSNVRASTAPRPPQAQPAGDRAHGSRVVAGDHLDAHVLFREIRQRTPPRPREDDRPAIPGPGRRSPGRVSCRPFKVGAMRAERRGSRLGLLVARCVGSVVDRPFAANNTSGAPRTQAPYPSNARRSIYGR